MPPGIVFQGGDDLVKISRGAPLDALDLLGRHALCHCMGIGPWPACFSQIGLDFFKHGLLSRAGLGIHVRPQVADSLTRWGLVAPKAFLLS
jgi:hypothetical protein